MTTATTKKLATVVDVHGISPDEWLADPQNVYCGRYSSLTRGKYKLQKWPASGFANPYRFGDGFTRTEKIGVLFNYAKALRNNLNRSELLRCQFLALEGKVLGCWCVNWDASWDQAPPLCHAAWLARIVNIYFAPNSRGVLVHPNGAITAMTVDIPIECVAFRKVRQ